MEKTIGVASRRLPFTLVENVLLEDEALGAVDVLVYLALAKHADAEGTCWPSMATIGKVARCSRQTVAEAIKHLAARGYITRTARFRPDGGVTSNVYQLLKMKVAAPVAVVDTPCKPGRQGPVAYDDTNYIQSELDQKKGNPAARIAAAQSSPLICSKQPEDALLCELADLPVLAHDHRFLEGVRWLLSEGKTLKEITEAVRLAAEDPQERGGLSFIADRFPRWERRAKERARRSLELTQAKILAEERSKRERQEAEDRKQIIAWQESEQGQAEIAAILARLPWRRENQTDYLEKTETTENERADGGTPTASCLV